MSLADKMKQNRKDAVERIEAEVEAEYAKQQAKIAKEEARAKKALQKALDTLVARVGKGEGYPAVQLSTGAEHLLMGSHTFRLMGQLSHRHYNDAKHIESVFVEFNENLALLEGVEMYPIYCWDEHDSWLCMGLREVGE